MDRPDHGDGVSELAAGESRRDAATPGRSESVDPRLSRWRVVFPTISLVIGMIGIGVYVGFAAQVLFPEFRERQLGFALPRAPDLIRNWVVLQSTLLVLLGAMLVAGSALLLRRHPFGARLCLAWSAVRLMLVAANIAIGVAAFDHQVAWSGELARAVREGMVRNGADEATLAPLPSDEANRSRLRRWLVVMSFASATWPCVMAIVLTRRHVRDEVDAWRRGEASRRVEA